MSLLRKLAVTGEKCGVAAEHNVDESHVLEPRSQHATHSGSPVRAPRARDVSLVIRQAKTQTTCAQASLPSQVLDSLSCDIFLVLTR